MNHSKEEGSEKVRSAIIEGLDKNRIKERLIRLVGKPNPQTERFEEEPLVLSFIRDTVKSELSSIGIKDVQIDAKGNLIARVGEEARGKGPCLALVSYGMSPAPGAMPDPYSGKVVSGSDFGLEGECIWGRGASEQKSSLAAMISALEIIIKLGLDLPQQIVFITSTAGETGRHDSIDYIVKNDDLNAKWAIISGPPQIVVANKGRIDVHVVIYGRASHSSRPWEGLNAIDGAMLVLERLQKIMPNPEPKEHPHLGKVTLAANRIQSFPVATHTIQDRCEITLDRRLLPGDEPDSALRQIREAIGDTAPFRVTVEQGAFMYPSETPSDSAIVKTMSSAIKSMLNLEPELFYSHSTIDAGYLNRAGIQTVLYGSAVTSMAHSVHEMVPLNLVFDATKVYVRAALTDISHA